MPEKPNILYLHSHDTGRYIQPYGYAVPTPNLQNFAEQGVIFRQAFCGGPTCSASRAVLVTGQCAHSSGMIGLAHRGFILKDYSQRHDRSLNKLESSVEHLKRELIKREAETPWIIKAIEEANQKTTQVFIDLINKTYGNNQRLFKIIFLLLGAILALSGAREAVTFLFK